MRVRNVMTTDPGCCGARDSAREAARQMIDYHAGLIPVIDAERKLVGVVTDRDLATRGIVAGKGPDTPVEEMMSSSVVCCQPDDNAGVAAEMMADRQVRRIPVVDDDQRIVGIVVQADLAQRADVDADLLGDTVSEVSAPTDVSSTVDPSDPDAVGR